MLLFPYKALQNCGAYANACEMAIHYFNDLFLGASSRIKISLSPILFHSNGEVWTYGMEANVKNEKSRGFFPLFSSGSEVHVTQFGLELYLP